MISPGAQADSADGTMARVRQERRASGTDSVSTTRATIAEALLTLSHDDTPLTVSAVVRRAGVSRATFYTHFADLGEVIAMIHEATLADIAIWQQEALTGDSDWSEVDAQRESFRRFAVHVDQNRVLYAAIFDLPIGSDVRRRVSAAMSDALLERLEKVATPPPGIDPELLTASLAAAYMEILSVWIRAQRELTVEDVMLHFTALMPDWLVDPAHRADSAD